MHGQVQLIERGALVVDGLADVGAGVVARQPGDVETRAPSHYARARGAAAQGQAVARPGVRDGRGIGARGHGQEERLALHADELAEVRALEDRLVCGIVSTVGYGYEKFM